MCARVKAQSYAILSYAMQAKTPSCALGHEKTPAYEGQG
jgi:hypothetical protein